MRSHIEREELAALWSQGKTVAEIAEQTNCNFESVRYLAKKYELGRHPKATRNARATLTSEEKSTIADLRRAGKSWRDIAKTIGKPVTVCHEAVNGRMTVPKWDDDTAVLVPKAQIEERRARLAAPARDLTASIFGDPPVGYSAWDKRNGK